MLSFVNPSWLWLMPLAVMVPAGVWAMRRGRGGARLVAMLAQGTCLGLLILALARPVWEGKGRESVLVAVIDLGVERDRAEYRRILDEVDVRAGEMAAMNQARTRTRFVVFDGRAMELSKPGVLLEESGAASVEAMVREERRGPVPAEALQLAGSFVPEGARGGVVCFGGEVSGLGDTEAELLRLGSRGITVTQARQDVNTIPAIRVESVESPAAAAVGQTIPMSIRVTSTTGSPVEVRVNSEGRRLAVGEPVEHGREGENGNGAGDWVAMSARVPMRQAGLVNLEVEVLSAGERVTREVAVWVAGPRRVLVVGEETSRAAQALRQVMGEAAEVLESAPGGMNLDEVNLLVFTDHSVGSLNGDSAGQVREFVAQGGGLLVTGGARAFSPEGWAGSELASMLPVRFSSELETKDPSTAVVFIIDTSGSMGPRLDLAKEVARLAMRKLEAHDKMGVVEFYGAKRWAAPLQSAANRLDLERAVNRLTSGGGTEIYPAVEEAAYALRNVNTRTKHVVVLTDGGVESAPFEPLIRRMSERGQTLSTVVIGTDPSPLMEAMAEWGGGRFYRVTGRLGIPELQFRRPDKTPLPPTVETPTSFQVSPVLSALGPGEPVSQLILDGHVRLDAKPTADRLLTSSEGNSGLFQWQYGRGKVAVLASPLGTAWTRQMMGSDQGASMIATLSRNLQGREARGELIVEPILRPAGLEIAVRSSRAVDPAPVEIRLSQGGRVVRTMVADPINSVGAWNVLMGVPPVGTFKVEASLPGLELRGEAGAHVPVGPMPQSTHLSRLAGESNRLAKENAPLGNVAVVHELSGIAAGGAMLSFLVHVYFRRSSSGPKS